MKEDLNLLEQFEMIRRTDDEDLIPTEAIQLPPKTLEQLSALQRLPAIQDLVRNFLYFKASLRSEEYFAMSVTGI